MRICRSFVLLCLLVSQVACQGGLQRLFAGTPPSDPEAEALKRSGQYASAIRRYEQLASNTGNPDHYWLEAADTALRSGDAQTARQLADHLKVQNLSDADRDRWALFSSRLDLSQGRAQEALARLNSLPERRLSETDQRNYHLLKASALNQQGDMTGSALERIALSPLLSRQEDVDRNHQTILETLERLPNQTLKTPWHQPPAEMAGWRALALVMKTDGNEVSPALDQWQRQYPGHPANGRLLSLLRGHENPLAEAKSADNASRRGPFIGILLPQDGPYAPAASTIRQGLESAHERDPDPQKPGLRFLDTTKGHLLEDLEMLADEGAIGMIGPLIKEDVKTLMGRPTRVPVLALNHVDGLASRTVFQFGLTPEEEVEQVAARAFADGRRDARIIYPETAFGQRLAQHFEQTWIRLGGHLSDKRPYPEAAPAATPLVLSGGSFAESEMIFLIADASQARTLAPRLREAHAPKIYGTSKMFESHRDEHDNQALTGVIYCDMPALMAGKVIDHAESARLMALGQDAYRILPVLQSASMNPDWRWVGETGSLTMNADHQILRHLTCAEWVNGHPQAPGSPISQ